LADWIAEKMLAAQDETYREAKNAHSKWMRHQVSTYSAIKLMIEFS